MFMKLEVKKISSEGGLYILDCITSLNTQDVAVNGSEVVSSPKYTGSYKLFFSLN